MKIEHPAKEPHRVEEWEFSFNNGSALAITIDPALGDTYEFSVAQPVAQFHLTEKPSPISPDSLVDAEDVFVTLANTNCVRKCTRIKRESSFEEKEEIQQVLRELSGSSIKH